MSGRLALLFVVAVVAGGALSAQAPAACSGCVEARFWEVNPTFWSGAAPQEQTPEHARLVQLRKVDLGIAFSGGGTRSASATLGQLRGLEENGWLTRVRYMTAVSGGSWAAVPYAYSRKVSLVELLGDPRPLDPATGQRKPLDPTAIEKVPDGLIATRIVESKLSHVGVVEAPSFLPDTIGGRDLVQTRRYLQLARAGIRKLRKRELPEPNRQNKTYAHMLGQVFLDGIVEDWNRKQYAWDDKSAIDMSTSGRALGDFITMDATDRPFLIVGGTLVKPNGLGYPRLIPVEYTALYTGVRQQFGQLGGTYVPPWAYDRLVVAPRSGTHMLVGPKPTERPFTLADVIASSGAAPQLTLMLGDKVPERFRSALRRASLAFPAFNNLAVRKGEPNPVSAELAHGDGGFTDNLGIMPLLARQVRNIIVFVNSSSEYRENAQLQSYFMPLEIRDGNGDKTMNPVFEKGKYLTVLKGFDDSTKAGGGAVFCEKNWTVKHNELYNIRGYTELNICWVYNHMAKAWLDTVPAEIKAWIRPTNEKKLSKQAKALRNFPYYKTFGQNRTRVIQLKPLQVNLLADLAAWSISNKQAVDAIVQTFGETVVPTPQTTR
jgi:hypothetical protein